MQITRRAFLRAGSMVGLASLFASASSSRAFGQQEQNGTKDLGTGIGFRIPKSAASDPLAHIPMDTFRKCVGDTFQFSTNTSKKVMPLSLWAVNDLNPPSLYNAGTSTNSCFGLVFNAPSAPLLTQGTYAVQHATLGKFNLFIVPAAGTVYNQHYEAIINRVFP